MLLPISTVDCLHDMCYAMPAYHINPDVAGLSPTSSYIIQVAVTPLLPFLHAMLFELVPHTQVFLSRHGLKNDEQRHDARLHMVLETIFITLSDFQRTQCCFTIAVHFACPTHYANTATLSQLDWQVTFRDQTDLR
jgi:hypothetical protein